MTKEEAQILYEQCHDGTLRKPNCIPCADTKTLDMLLKNAIGLVFFKNADQLSPLERSYHFVNCKRALKTNPFVKKLKGSGTANKPYRLSTIFGDGKFLDMHSTFDDGKIPEFVEKNYCFSNCMIYSMLLAKQEIDCTVLTGIAHFETPFLHAVLLGWHNDEPQIFDFNYDLVMDQELYTKLFSFEVLSKVDGQALLQAKDIIKSGVGKVNDYQLLLAYDDCIKYKKEELARQQQTKTKTPATQKEEKDKSSQQGSFGENDNNSDSQKSDLTPIN